MELLEIRSVKETEGFSLAAEEQALPANLNERENSASNEQQ